MNYTPKEIEQTALKIGLSKSIVKSLIDGLPHKRSSQENKALHVLFQNIAFELNRIGMEFTYRGIKGKEIQTTYSAEIVKNYLWRPLQIALLDKQSTTKLNHSDIEAIFLILGRWFAENGVVIEFPSIETILNKER